MLPTIQIYIRQKYMSNVLNTVNDNINTPEIMNYITIMPKYFYQNYDMFLKFWLPFACALFFFTCFLSWYTWSVGVVSALYFLGLFFAFFYGYMYLVSISRRYFENEEKMLSSYEDILINNESVNGFNARKIELENLKQKEEDNNENMKELVWSVNIFQFIFLFLSLSFMLGLFFYMNHLRIRKRIPNWKFFVFITIIFFMIREIILVNGYVTRAVYQQGSLRNIEIFEEMYPSSESDISNTNFPFTENYDLELKNVDYSFDDLVTHDDVSSENNEKKEVELLKNVNLKIKKFENLLIKGSIGSGKSTLAKLIMKWYKPKNGEIFLNQENLQNLSIESIRKHQYFMSQNTVLFSNRTVFENIFYQVNQKELSDDKSKNMALSKLNLPTRFMNILHKVVKKNGVNISGGTKRLVHILRCFFHPANLVIMDEPTDNLDETTTKLVMKLIQDLQKIKTIICISHDSRLNSIFSNFYYLS
jgi:ABC-type multidrug transport system fused ATPase/permease subunit